MLYHLLYPLRDFIFAFNIFRYISFRAAMAALTAFVLSLIFGPLLINKLKALKVEEKINSWMIYTTISRAHRRWVAFLFWAR